MAWVHALVFACILPLGRSAAVDAVATLQACDVEELGLSLLQQRSNTVRPVSQATGVPDTISPMKDAPALIDADEKEAEEVKIADSFYSNLASAEGINTSTVLMAGKLRSPTEDEKKKWAEETKNLTAKMKRARKAAAKQAAADKKLEEKLFAEHQRKFNIAFKKGTKEKEAAQKAAQEAAQNAKGSRAAAEQAVVDNKSAQKKAIRKQNEHEAAAEEAAITQGVAHKAADEKLAAEQAALEKAEEEKEAEKKAAAAKKAEVKAAAERAVAEEAAELKESEEREALREAARIQAEADRAAEEAAEKEAIEKAAVEKAARAADLEEQADLSAAKEAAIEKAEIYAAAAEKAKAQKGFEKAENTSCGWTDSDFSCQWDNQVYANAGSRVKTGTSREHALEVCARICEDAGIDCAGFAWMGESCYFRRDVTCGRESKADSDCYTKLAQVQSAPELQDDEAKVPVTGKDMQTKSIAFRAQDPSCDHGDERCLVKVKEMTPGTKAEGPWAFPSQQQLKDSSGSTVQDVYFKAKDANCGWWEIDDDCAWSNLAHINNELNVAEAKSREDALELCGRMCSDAGDECGGFTWRDQKCNFRVNAKCGVMALPGSDCYVKHSLMVLHQNSGQKKDSTEAKQLLAEKAKKLLARLESDEKEAQEAVEQAAKEVKEQEAAAKKAQKAADKAFAEEWKSVKAEMKAKQELAIRNSEDRMARAADQKVSKDSAAKKADADKDKKSLEDAESETKEETKDNKSMSKKEAKEDAESETKEDVNDKKSGSKEEAEADAKSETKEKKGKKDE